MQIAEETWQQGPRVLNAEIARLIYEHTPIDKEKAPPFATSYDVQQWLKGKPARVGTRHCSPLGTAIDASTR